MEALVSITDELREWCVDRVFMGNGYAEVLGIADRIDTAHRSALEKLAAQVDESERSGFDQGFASADDWLAQHEDAMAEHGWIRLPLDSDGEYIRAGDVLDGYGKTIEVVELRHGRSGWVIISRDGNAYADTFAFSHYHAPTVEDVLDEFFGKANLPDGTQTRAEIIAEYAAKLRLAEEVDA